MQDIFNRFLLLRLGNNYGVSRYFFSNTIINQTQIIDLLFSKDLLTPCHECAYRESNAKEFYLLLY